MIVMSQILIFITNLYMWHRSKNLLIAICVFSFFFLYNTIMSQFTIYLSSAFIRNFDEGDEIKPTQWTSLYPNNFIPDKAQSNPCYNERVSKYK